MITPNQPERQISSDEPTAAGGVRSVKRSLQLLDAIAERRTATLSDLAADTGLTPSTAHRLLATLAESGYIARDAQQHFRLGPRMLALAETLTGHPLADLRAAAHPHLEQLRDEFGESANLFMLDGATIVGLDHVQSTGAIRIHNQVGNRGPAHASGSGKAILSRLADDDLERRMGPGPFKRLTAQTITDIAELRSELRLVRERGYAIDNREFDEGVMCLAAPIVELDGTASAALSVSGPAYRMVDLDHGAIVARLLHATQLVAGRAGPTLA
jgi:DNA-binding IclR family transcriptional regulator